MAAQTVSTDIAGELNITARRNDSFKFQLAVTDPTNTGTDGNTSLIMVGGINGAATSNIYQGKLTVIDSSSGDVKLILFSARWTSSDTEATTDPNSSEPTATSQGLYYGSSSGGTNVGGGIDFSAMSTDAAGNRVTISCPYTYMSFEPGTYKYDLQIRKRISTTLDTEFTTWLYGNLTLLQDVTQL